jgi:hypothetical protein
MKITESALIGHTGLVGSTLARSRSFKSLFNSKNIGEMCGNHYSSVVCAGVRAEKWVANRNPAQDWDNIQKLINVLEKISCDHFTLISTVDVFADTQGADEKTYAGSNNAPYGLHRFQLEEWVRERFRVHKIIRLPGLFGAGLKKNILFDLIHDNSLENVSLGSSFQWYPLRRLARDLDVIESHGPDLIHIATAPVPTDELVERLFPSKRSLLRGTSTAKYDIRSVYFDLLGLGANGYHICKDEILDEISKFVVDSRL